MKTKPDFGNAFANTAITDTLSTINNSPKNAENTIPDSSVILPAQQENHSIDDRCSEEQKTTAEPITSTKTTPDNNTSTSTNEKNEEVIGIIKQNKAEIPVFASTNQTNELIKRKPKISSSKKALLPGFLIAITVLLCANYIPMNMIVEKLFSQEDFLKLPVFIQNNLGGAIKIILYFVAGISAYIAIKAKMKGTLRLYPSYIEYKKGFSKPIKIMYTDITSIDVHWCVLSLIGDVGNIEISSPVERLYLENYSAPGEIKTKILKNRERILTHGYA